MLLTGCLPVDIATMETGDLKDDLSKRLQGISTSITEIQTQNASDFLMQDNAGLIFNPERFTDVQKDSVLKQSNIFKRYDTNDELDPQEKKILLQINYGITLILQAWYILLSKRKWLEVVLREIEKML